MFDPSAVKSTAKIVRAGNGMYAFRGTYVGPVEFFRGRPMEEAGIWTAAHDVTEVPVDAADPVVGEVVEWSTSDRPRLLDE